eukprot:evm.model.NODE_26333_length_6330_cov_16.381674.2
MTVALDLKEGGLGSAFSRGVSEVTFKSNNNSTSSGSTSGSIRSSPMVNVSFTDTLGKERKPLQKLKTDVPGVFIYPLKPTVEPKKAYSQAVVEETWENERSDCLTCRWRSPFLPADRDRWSDEQGKRERKRENITLPSPEWMWLDDWHVDMGLGEVGTEIDVEGWTYGVEFPGFTLNRIKRTHRDMDGVRRRRWIRTRVPLPPALDDPTRPLSVAWRVNLLPDGRTELSVETTVQLVNETDVALEVLAVIDPALPPHPLDPIPPQSTVCIPLLLAYASTVRIRPMSLEINVDGEGEEGFKEPKEDRSPYQWSEPFLVDRGAGAAEEVVICPPSSSSLKPIPVCVVVDATVTGAGFKSIFLRPPFLFENLLPCHVWVSVSPHDREHHTCLIAPGAKAGVLSKEPQVSQSVRIRLAPNGGRRQGRGSSSSSSLTCGGYEWSQECELGGVPGKFQNLKPFVLPNHLTGEE